jgi:hypothetical protein
VIQEVYIGGSLKLTRVKSRRPYLKNKLKQNGLVAWLK